MNSLVQIGVGLSEWNLTIHSNKVSYEQHIFVHHITSHDSPKSASRPYFRLLAIPFRFNNNQTRPMIRSEWTKNLQPKMSRERCSTSSMIQHVTTCFFIRASPIIWYTHACWNSWGVSYYHLELWSTPQHNKHDRLYGVRITIAENSLQMVLIYILRNNFE